jgi:hypothetical protein
MKRVDDVQCVHGNQLRVPFNGGPAPFRFLQAFLKVVEARDLKHAGCLRQIV